MARRVIPSIRERHKLEEMVGPIGFWKQIQQYQFQFMSSMGLQPYHYLLDVGCGPLSGGLVFIPYLDNGRYVGMDVSEEAIAEAHRQIVKHRLVSKNPRLLLSSSFGQDELNGQMFDYVLASQILYHLDSAGIERCIKNIATRLSEHGKFYGDIIGTPNEVTENSRWAGFRFHLHEVEFMREVSERNGLNFRVVGQLGDLGYPQSISLHTSLMLEFSR